MIGLLRFIGILNAAVWFGTAIFFALGVGPAVLSPEVEKLLGGKNYPYFSAAIGQILLVRYFRFQLACAIVATLHVMAERLYLGKTAEKSWLALLSGLFALNLLGGAWFQPKLTELNTLRYAANARVEDRQVAGRAFVVWHRLLQGVNFLTVAGLGIYLWRVANPADPTRFLRTNKFRS